MSKKHWDPDWVCPLCVKTIYGSKSSCGKCKTPKLKKGDWVCSCRTFNFSDKTACIACQLPKPAFCVCEDPSFSKGSRSGYSYHKGKSCRHCRGEENKDYWICRCLKQRGQTQSECGKCEARKPECCTCRESDFTRNEYIEGGNCLRCCLPDRNSDWTCQCGGLNFDFKSTCTKCQTAKPKICGCEGPKFNQRTTLDGQVVDCGPCLNCQKSSPVVTAPVEKPVKKRGQVQVLEDRIAQLEQEAAESKRRFAELEARLARLESQ